MTQIMLVEDLTSYLRSKDSSVDRAVHKLS